eukprot:GDKH01028612.1.p3 GENE.GDKH01028612.1~~GDKH01028612.1.p3  ORF type:complete len:60 (-),score=6.84 GDKH01028612.1:121-300(-)
MCGLPHWDVLGHNPVKHNWVAGSACPDTPERYMLEVERPALLTRRRVFPAVATTACRCR